MKYEFNKVTGMLELDRILSPPYLYPHAYGFVPNTLAADGDELDALIICDSVLRNDVTYDAHIVGALCMEDEHGMDDKLLCTLDGAPVSADLLAEIETFFANYKKLPGADGRWSKTYGFITKEEAITLYHLAASGSLALL